MKINPFTTLFFCLISLIIGTIFGYSMGIDRVLYKDHIQATAGIFIDGYNKNIIYDIIERKH